MATPKKPSASVKKGSTKKAGTGSSPAAPQPVAAVAAVAGYAGELLSRTPELLAKARSYKDELRQRMKKAPSFAAFAAQAAPTPQSGSNVLGMGFGAKSTEGAGFEEGLAVRVYVRTKLPRSGLTKQELVPGDVNGLPTDVVAVGDLRAHTRPTLCGVSVGHRLITAGTLGCLVRKKGGKDPAVYMLSNNHVLANTNQAAVGDPILEPGPLDGGDPANPIANLSDFEPLDFTAANHFDAAIAQLIKTGDVDPQILIIGATVPPPMEPAIYQSVRKRGRTTLHTVGVVLDLAADVRVRYGTQTAEFADVLSISGLSGGLFSDGGDSGSLVVDAVTRRPVALLFAGGNGTTFASPIQPVLDRFGIEIL